MTTTITLPCHIATQCGEEIANSFFPVRNYHVSLQKIRKIYDVARLNPWVSVYDE
jgi:hypothetical protein